MVVLVSGAVAEVAAYAETVLMNIPLRFDASSRSLAKVMFSGHLAGWTPASQLMAMCAFGPLGG
jgi:hypothetical protein